MTGYFPSTIFPIYRLQTKVPSLGRSRDQLLVRLYIILTLVSYPNLQKQTIDQNRKGKKDEKEKEKKKKRRKKHTAIAM